MDGDMTEPRILEGRTAVVFGAGSIKPGMVSNGQAAAVTYARAGARVAVIDIVPEAAEETRAMIAAEGGEALMLVADVSDEQAVAAAIAATVEQLGSIDVLHNNVGLLTFGTTLRTDAATWDRVMAVNVRGMFLAVKAALPHMITRERSSIINVSALASIRHLGPAITYATSKSAVNGFTQAVALEHARDGVRCNAILPGFIDTPVGLGVYETLEPGEAEARLKRRNTCLPPGRAGTPWDIAATALFLASDASAYINGQLIPVDGGVMHLSPTAV
jgi:NAD(P)-dependent dehydrogenase (short-subunit alcohol dehydrogenase family)